MGIINQDTITTQSMHLDRSAKVCAVRSYNSRVVDQDDKQNSGTLKSSSNLTTTYLEFTDTHTKHELICRGLKSAGCIKRRAARMEGLVRSGS